MRYIKSLCLFLIIVVMAGCNNNADKPAAEQQNVMKKGWEDIESLAEGSTVRLFTWGGDEGINTYIDEWVTPRLKETYGITLKRQPMNTEDFIQKLLAEKRAGKNPGTMDVMWINGENFRRAKENELLWTSFISKLPNYQRYIDKEGLNTKVDMGTKIEGLEAPWGKVQFVYVYDSAKIKQPPNSFMELKQWVKEHPGKFTYPSVNDFTGNAFVRHLLYYAAEDKKVFANKGFDKQWLDNHGDKIWSYLNDIERYLWRNGETYPQSLSALDELYSDGVVSMTMGFNAARAESLVQEGRFPKTTRAFVMESPGSIGNTHYLSIPFNSPHKAAAMVAINFLLSPEAQLAKIDPSMWGENTVLDPEKLPEKYRKELTELNRGKSVLPANVLQKTLLPDLNARYAQWIRENWVNEVVRQ